MVMAETASKFDWVDKRKTQGTGTIPGTAGTTVNYNSVDAMRARLIAIDPVYWTARRLDVRCENDLVYALRLYDDAAGF